MRYELAVFDMDGTILDTLDDLAAALNHALAACTFPTRTRDEVESFIGNGIRRLVACGVPEGTGEDDVERVHEAFVAYYRDHLADRTRPYSGIVPLLHALRAEGCHTAVVSNKDDGAVRALCDAFFEGLFDAAVGYHDGVRRKPAPDTVEEVIGRLGIAREHAVYIGDTEVDRATARNARMDCILVSWGFRTRAALEDGGPDAIVDEPEEIRELILGNVEDR